MILSRYVVCHTHCEKQITKHFKEINHQRCAGLLAMVTFWQMIIVKLKRRKISVTVLFFFIYYRVSSGSFGWYKLWLWILFVIMIYQDNKIFVTLWKNIWWQTQERKSLDKNCTNCDNKINLYEYNKV